MFLFIFQLPFLFSRSSFLLLLNSLKVNCLFHPSSNFLFFYSASAKYFDFFYGIFILIFSFSFFEFLLILQISLNYFHIYTLFFSKAFCFLLSCSKFSVSFIVFFFFLLLLTFKVSSTKLLHHCLICRVSDFSTKISCLIHLLFCFFFLYS
jgi:hypothetical protein